MSRSYTSRKFAAIFMMPLVVGILLVGCSGNSESSGEENINNETVASVDENESHQEESSDVSDNEEETESATEGYYYAGDEVILSTGVTYTIVDTGKYTEASGTYAYVELDIDNQSGSDLTVSSADIRFYADDYLLETGYPLTADDTILSQTVSNGRKTSGRFYAECSDYDSSDRIEAEIGSVVIVIKDSASEVNEASSSSGEYEEDVYAEALEYHNLDFETVRNIVTIYVYDEEYVSTLDDVDIYYAFENAIGDQHIMMDMGYRDLYYDTETEIDEIREFLWSSEVSILTQEEAEGLDDYDAVGLYGVMCQYADRLYAE